MNINSYSQKILSINHYFFLILSIWLIFPFALWSQENQPKSLTFLFPDHAYQSHDWQSFYLIREVQDTINLQHPSYSLLNAAVFYATNKVRMEFGLTQFQFSSELRNMANQHARAMAKYDFVDHKNTHQKEYRTMALRSKKFRANAISENVASTFLYDYISGANFYRVWKETYYQYFTDEGKLIPLHTYLSFAESLVQNWMDSPGHRKAILSEKHQTLGCAVAIPFIDMRKGYIPLAFATQNFGD